MNCRIDCLYEGEKEYMKEEYVMEEAKARNHDLIKIWLGFRMLCGTKSWRKYRKEY